MPGYSTVLKQESAVVYDYPYGSKWEEMFAEGLFTDPRKQSVFVCPAK
jgi:hypothetical protein